MSLTKLAAPRLRTALAAGLMALAALPAAAETVGKVGVDWIGNDIYIDAVTDPEVSGVTCHVTYFDRSVIDRLKKGNWFEDRPDHHRRHRARPRGRRGLQVRPVADLEVADRHAHLRQEERHADLSRPFARTDGRIGEDVDLHRAALWRDSHLDERQALKTQDTRP
jgi:hypothetical protein